MSHSNAYVEAFLTKKPKDGIHIVQQRLTDATTLDIELADYLKERAQIEEDYSKSLVKASKRLYTMNPIVLGHFAPIWETLLKEFNQIATYHSEMAFQIINEIEKPLRTISLSEHYQKLEQMEPIIQSFEKKSNNKLSSVKGSIFKKSTLKTNASWENEGVEYLKTSQKVDESRLNRLKHSIEKFEQIQSKQLKKRIELTQVTLNNAKSFNIQNDIQDFCLERGKGLDIIKKRPKMSTSISHDSLRSTTSSTNKFKSVFMKKKNQHNRLDEYNDASPFSEQSIENQEPLQIDAEGYSVPKTTTGQLPFTSSDISSQTTSDEVNSDYQSIKLNQRLQINIKDDIVKEEDTLANESFNKMATILRERTPTITRKARGRRDSSMTRSQTDVTLNSSVSDNNISTNTVSNNNNKPRSNSMINFGSIERSSTNPFLQTNIHSANNFKLQPINEDRKADISIFVQEKSNIGSDILGKIFISYTGSTVNPIMIRLSNMKGIQRLYPNPQYITVTDDKNDYYALNTSSIPQNERVICFIYELNSNEINSSLLLPPVSLSASWKCIEGISYLMVKHMNRNLSDSMKGSVQVHYDHVTHVESTPQGIWDTQNKILKWQLKDLLHQYEQQQKSRLLAKFFLTKDQIGTPQPLSLSYQLEDTLASALVVEIQEDEPSTHTTNKIYRTVYLEHLILD